MASYGRGSFEGFDSYQGTSASRGKDYANDELLSLSVQAYLLYVEDSLFT